MGSGTHEMPALAGLTNLRFRVGSATQKGTRPGKVNNEDSLARFVSPLGEVLIVADGMGGHGHGDLASAIVVSSFRDTLLAASGMDVAEAMRYALQIAHSRIIQTVEQNGLNRGVGSTVVVAIVQGNIAHIGHVGDSRCYLYHRDELIQLTRDHSLVQAEIEAGRLTEEQALLDARASTLTRAVGATDNLDMEILQPLALLDGDALMMCSDGLHGFVDRTGILFVMRKNLHDPQRVAEALVSLAANSCNSDDDVTVVFGQLGEPKLTQPAPVFTQGRSEELQASRLSAAAPKVSDQPVPSEELIETETMPAPAPPPRPALIELPVRGEDGEAYVDRRPRPKIWWVLLFCLAALGLGVAIGIVAMRKVAPAAPATPAKETPANKEDKPSAKSEPAKPPVPALSPGKTMRVLLVNPGKPLGETLQDFAKSKLAGVLEQMRKEHGAGKGAPGANLELVFVDQPAPPADIAQSQGQAPAAAEASPLELLVSTADRGVNGVKAGLEKLKAECTNPGNKCSLVLSWDPQWDASLKPDAVIRMKAVKAAAATPAATTVQTKPATAKAPKGKNGKKEDKKK